MPALPFRARNPLFSLGLTLQLAAAATANALPNPSIDASDPAIRAWADGASGFAPATDGSAPGDDANALGPADGTLVSLGDLSSAEISAGDDPGQITLSFSRPIRNGPGEDLAVFENAFDFFPPDDEFVFAELAFVEVSSNGLDFARLPSISLNTEGAGNPATDILIPDFGAGPARDFAGILIENTENLAGVHALGLGTLFDLEDVSDHPLVLAGLVDLEAIGYVRLVDVPGDGSFVDSLGNPILDAWSTATGFGSAGFDLDAVGALHVVPEPGTGVLVLLGLAALARRQRGGRACR